MNKVDDKKLLQSLPTIYYVIEADSYKIIDTNDPNEGVLNSQCYQYIFNYDKPCDKYGENCSCSEMKSGKKISEQIRIHKKKDGVRYLKAIASPLLNEKGDLEAIITQYIDITESIVANEARQISEEKFEAIFNNSAMGIFRSTPEGRYLNVNPAFAHILGFENPESLISEVTNISDLYTRPKDREEIIKILLKTGSVENYEVQAKHPIHKSVWISINANLVNYSDDTTFIEGTIQDITERKNSANSLIESEKNNRFLYDAVKELIHLESIEQLYDFTAGKLFELMNHQGVVTIADYSLKDNLWKMKTVIGASKFQKKVSELLGYDFNKMQGEIETSFVDLILTGNFQKIDFDIPLLTKDRISLAIGNKIKKLFSLSDLYCISFKHDENVYGNISLMTNNKTPVLDKSLIEAFVSQVSIFIGKKLAEEQLLLSENKFRNFIEQSGEGHMIIDSDYKIIEWNKAMEDISGLPGEKVIGEKAWSVQWEIMPDDTKKGLSLEGLKKILYKWFEELKVSKEPKFHETDLKHKSGELRSINQVIYKIESGQNLFFGISFVDITDRKRDEKLLQEKNKEIAAQNEELQKHLDRILQINNELALAKQKAEQADKLKTAFLANMSHEIRTPLNALLGFSGLLAKPGKSPEKLKHYANLIDTAGDQLLTIIDDLVDISKIESGQMRVEKRSFELFPFINGILELYNQDRFKWLRKDLEFKLSYKLQKDIFVFTDETRLAQIINNLLNNAFKFTDIGVVELGLEKVSKDGSAHIKFYVKDTGIGIPKDKANDIFQRFVQVNIVEIKGGTGLGLSISKGLVELLGGTIWVDSKPGKGSVFYFTIPITAK